MKESPERYLSVPAILWFIGPGIVGFALCLFVTEGTDRTLGWIVVPQACAMLAVWPHFHRNLHYVMSPLALIFLSVPLYAAGIMLGGIASGETAMTLILLCMLFLYVSFLFRLEEVRGIQPGAWYIPLSTILVAGPVLVYYILAEFLRYPMPWIMGISPVVALSGGAHLRTGCVAWVGVLIVTAVAGLLEVKEEK